MCLNQNVDDVHSGLLSVSLPRLCFGNKLSINGVFKTQTKSQNKIKGDMNNAVIETQSNTYRVITFPLRNKNIVICSIVLEGKCNVEDDMKARFSVPQLGYRPRLFQEDLLKFAADVLMLPNSSYSFVPSSRIDDGPSEFLDGHKKSNIDILYFEQECALVIDFTRSVRLDNLPAFHEGLLTRNNKSLKIKDSVLGLPCLLEQYEVDRSSTDFGDFVHAAVNVVFFRKVLFLSKWEAHSLRNLFGQNVKNEKSLKKFNKKCGNDKECPADYFAFKIISGAANVVGPSICFENTV
ncbi:unnamed protein product [Ranitomeya imitator]|uniref:Uncharacterized protein n=1 Tax=Ranitomeya imitator TaxID=111125 RepID=A0ABN9LA65_9NEOB|nr:unnamed protein product [Ranitomeya imitator]